MASHFRWYPAESEIVVPWNARYSFPSQSNKAIKMTPRIPPKNNSTFNPGAVIRLEFPAQGYVNPAKTTLEFDVTLLYTPADADFSAVRFQNNIQSIFSRVRLLYGATPLEDIPNYNAIVRSVTDWTASDPLGPDQTSVSEGIGGVYPTISGSGVAGSGVNGITKAAGSLNPIIGNVRQKMIHGVDLRGTASDASNNTGFGVVPNGVASTALTNRATINSKNPTRRYQVQLALGMLTQEKLIPTKFMASQLAIEITLANPSDCIYHFIAGTQSSPSYQVTNINLIPEILEFDASYDESFLRGLQNGGVPIKFSTWNNYRYNVTGQQSLNLQIQERSRSVKAIFAMLRREQSLIWADSGASFFNADVTTGNAASTLQDYQFRIGGRYFPASPVQNSTEVGGAVSNGGCESYVELQKALNILGQNTLSTGVNPLRWCIGPMNNSYEVVPHTVLPEFDFDPALVGFKSGGGAVYVLPGGVTGADIGKDSRAGDIGSACFAMAIDLETSNGLEISGLNAEEQSDISLIVRYSKAQGSSAAASSKDLQTVDFEASSTGLIMDVFTYIDSMIVLRENVLFILTLERLGAHSVNCVIIIKMGELDQVYEYIELCLDSWDSSAAGGSSFEASVSPTNQLQYSWPQYYFTQKNLVVAGIKVLSAEIPFVFDTITPANNTFIFTVNGVDNLITIPTGTYTGISLAAQLQVLLSAVDAGFLVSWSPTTLRYTYTFAGAAVPWSFTFTSRATAYMLLGFLPNTTTGSTGPSSIVSTIVASPTGPYYLYLNSRTIGSLVNFNLPDASALGSGPEMCRIPVNANFGELIQYVDPDPEKYFDFFIGHQFNAFDFYLTLGSNQYQKPLDMKGAPWSIKLGLLVYRDASQNLGKRPASMMKGQTTLIQ